MPEEPTRGAMSVEPTATAPATPPPLAASPVPLAYEATAAAAAGPWYAGVTRYQWLVLVVASAGWVFDAFEGQLYNLTRTQMLPELLGPDAGSAAEKRWGDRLLAVFLVGGTVGGIAFGTLADRVGRK